MKDHADRMYKADQLLTCCVRDCLRIFASVITLTGMLHAQSLTMDAFLATLRSSHPLFVSESLSPEIERLAHKRHIGTQDWVVTSSPYFLYQEEVSSGIGVPTTMNLISADVGLRKSFWDTGGRLSLSWTTAHLDQTVDDIVIPMPGGDITIPVGPSDFYSNSVYLTYAQPLIQNLGGTLDKLEYNATGYAVDIARVQTDEVKEGFILNCAQRYLEWVFLYEQKAIAEERLSIAQQQLAQLKRKRKAYLIDEVDVLRAEDAVRIAQQGVVLIESRYRSKQAELAVLLGSDEPCTCIPDFDLYRLTHLPDPDSAVHMLHNMSRIVKALRIRREQLRCIAAGYEETRKPELYFSVSAGLRGGDTEFTESLNLDKPDVVVGLDFRCPIGHQQARADIAKTNLEIKQIDEDINTTMMELEAAVRSLLITISETEKVLLLNRSQIESAQAKTREEVRLYEQGRNLLTFVIQSRDDEQIAELTYAQNAVNYQSLVIQYRALMDGLLK
jgi:outer membrane protein TolC